MDRLILLRHGQAEPRAASGRDLDRALTDQGRGDAAAAGHALARAGWTPDVALVSTALRARQTWEAARAALKGEVATRETAALYDVPAGEVARLAGAAGAATVLVVGHNPTLQALAEALSGGDPRLAKGFPPASLAGFARADKGWRLDLLHLPQPA